MPKAKIPQPKSYARMTKRERSKLKNDVTYVNELISDLEKSGISSSSAAYRYLQAQHAAGANWLRKTKKGGLRFKGNISKMTPDQIAQLTREVGAYKRAKTRGVRGTQEVRQAMVDSFNERLKELGMSKRITDADEIKNIYESALYKSLDKQFYTERLKTYEIAERTHSKRFLQSIVKVSPKIDIQDLQELLENHKAYEQAVRGILKASDVQKLLIDYQFNTYLRPQDFAQLVNHISRHTEDDEELFENLKNYMSDREF